MNETVMQCPYCDDSCDCVHIQALVVNRGGEITTITNEGTRLRAGKPDGRGATVAITFWCENGHKWIRRFHFHKGGTFIEDELLISGCGYCMEAYTSELWRD